jgi:hydroxymethylglutaryl-CoA lyase
MDHRPALPTRIEITEVGMRDGLQMEAMFVPTETKARLIQRLVDAGVRQIEATSFVSPRAVPALRDAAELIASIDRRADVTISVLAPNRKGIERALAADVDEVVVFLSASESHNRKNLNRSIADSLNDMREAADVVRGTGVHLKGAIAVAFGCPFEGDISLDAITSIATRFADLGFSSVTLGDTTGMATPTNVRAAVTRLQQVHARHADQPALSQYARAGPGQCDGRSVSGHHVVRIIVGRYWWLPVCARRDRQRVYGGHGQPDE